MAPTIQETLAPRDQRAEGPAGTIGHCGYPACGGPLVYVGLSESGRYAWAECLICGNATGISVRASK